MAITGNTLFIFSSEEAPLTLFVIYKNMLFLFDVQLARVYFQC